MPCARRSRTSLSVPSSRRCAEIDEHTASVQKVVLFVEVDELERGARAVALFLGQAVERVCGASIRAPLPTLWLRSSTDTVVHRARAPRPPFSVPRVCAWVASGYLSRRPLAVFFCEPPMVPRDRLPPGRPPPTEPTYGRSDNDAQGSDAEEGGRITSRERKEREDDRTKEEGSRRERGRKETTRKDKDGGRGRRSQTKEGRRRRKSVEEEED